MPDTLFSVVTLTGIPIGGTQTRSHNLSCNGLALKPDLVLLSLVDTFALVSATTTQITITNISDPTGNCQAFCQAIHPVMRSFGLPPDDGSFGIHLTPQPFSPAAVGGGGGASIFKKFGIAPLLVPPDIGPGTINNYDPWTAAGVTVGSASAIVINNSALGVTLTGMVPTPDVGQFVMLEVGGDAHGFLTLSHMSPGSISNNRIYCTDACDAQIPKGGTAILQCLAQNDHGYRFLGMASGTRNNGGAPLSVTLPAGNTDNWNPVSTTGVAGRRWRVTTNVAGSVVTGMASSASVPSGPGGPINYNPGEIITITNLGDGINSLTATLTLKEFDIASSAGNRFILPGLADVVVPIYGTVQVMRDEFPSEGGIWVVLGNW